MPPAAPLPRPCLPPAAPCLPRPLPIPSRQGRHGSLPCLPRVGIGGQLVLLVGANLSPKAPKCRVAHPLRHHPRKATHQRLPVAVSRLS
jgi:hypothetical protein